MPDKIRSFIAFKMPPQVIDDIRSIQATLKKQGTKARWVNPDSIHLTLSFLGDILPDMIDDITQVIRQSAGSACAFNLSLNHIGVFPNLNRARVIWVGLKGNVQELLRLQNDMANRLEPLGFIPEKRPFKAHLTLGRFKTQIDSRKLAESLKGFNDHNQEFPGFKADTIHLFKSDLKPEGAVYTVLKSVILSSKES